MVASANQHPATALTAKTCRNINMLANSFAEYDYFLSKYVNFIILTPETINDMLNCNYLTDGLDLNMGKFNQYLETLNFLSPPENPQISKIAEA